MSQPQLRDPNRGPLKLQHDYLKDNVTPRDLSNYTKDVDANGHPDNFRYQGYPNGKFESPRNPVHGAHALEAPPQIDRYYGKPNHFDTNRPKGFDSPQGLQYGSDGQPFTRPGPKPIRDPFKEKTSAEVLKYRAQQEQVDKDYTKFKEEKVVKMHDRESEKKQDMEQLKNYNPWGKPGGGAPQGDLHKKKFTEVDEMALRTPPRPNQEYIEEYGDFHSQFGRPGAGAPMKTGSGKIRTEVRQDPAIRFQDTKQGRQVFEQEVRYKRGAEDKEHYGNDLEQQIKQKRLVEQEHKLADLKRELDQMKHDPYGRPGAGAPNKTASGTHFVTSRNISLTPDMTYLRRREESHSRAGSRAAAAARMMESRSYVTGMVEVESARTSQPLLQPSPHKPSAPQTRDFEFYDPWGKGHGQAMRDEYGDIMRHKQSNKQTGMLTQATKPQKFDSDDPVGKSLDLERYAGGAGAPIITESGNVRTRMPITMRRDDKGDTTVREEMPGRRSRQTPQDDPELQVYDPWGKGGAGAPMRDTQGNVQANVYGRMKNEVLFSVDRKTSATEQQRTAAKQQYLNELQHDMEMQKTRRDEQERSLKYGAGEMAAVIKQGQVGRARKDPNTGMMLDNHLPSSDVTKLATNSRSMKNEGSELYHTELERAAEDRKRHAQQERLKDKQESKHHQNTMNDFWGKPGAGAPQQTNKMGKLDDMLHTPREHIDPYGKKMPTGEDPYNYVRSTIPSTHVNMYELDNPLTREPKKDYKLFTPFATEKEEVY